MCVGAFISIPLPGAVPFTLQTAVIYFAALYLSKKECFFSILIYILTGVIGLPVFSGGSSGLGALFGPTGGFIFGFLVMAFVIGTFNDSAYFSIIIGTFVLYICGVTWFMIKMNADLYTALTYCVFPFILSDTVKALAANSAYILLKRYKTANY